MSALVIGLGGGGGNLMGEAVPDSSSVKTEGLPVILKAKKKGAMLACMSKEKGAMPCVKSKMGLQLIFI